MMKSILYILLCVGLNVNSLSYKKSGKLRFQVKKIEFDEINNAIDYSLGKLERVKAVTIEEEGLEEFKKKEENNINFKNLYADLLYSKKYVIKHIENKRVQYFALYNTTNMSNYSDLELNVAEPIIYIFVQVIPIIRVLSIEGLLFNPKSDYLETKDINSILSITKTYFMLLANHSGLIYDFHALKYFSNGRYFLDYSMIENSKFE